MFGTTEFLRGWKMLFLTLVCAPGVLHAESFDGFQEGECAGGTTTINIRLTGTPGEQGFIRWENPPGTLIAQLSYMIGVDGTFTLNWMVEHTPTADDRLQIYRDGTTVVDTDLGRWPNGGRGACTREPRGVGVVPTVSEWGLIVLGFLILGGGVIAIRRTGIPGPMAA